MFHSSSNYCINVYINFISKNIHGIVVICYLLLICIFPNFKNLVNLKCFHGFFFINKYATRSAPEFALIRQVRGEKERNFNGKSFRATWNHEAKQHSSKQRSRYSEQTIKQKVSRVDSETNRRSSPTIRKVLKHT